MGKVISETEEEIRVQIAIRDFEPEAARIMGIVLALANSTPGMLGYGAGKEGDPVLEARGICERLGLEWRGRRIIE